MARWIVKDENNLSGYEGLVAAIFIKALDDWCSLCDGDNPNRDKNFEELKEFFEGECEAYLVDTRLTGREIFERVKAIAKGAKA